MAGESVPLPRNRASFTFHDLVTITAGSAMRASTEPLVGVSTDTRSLAAGNVFVALRGPNFDGHQYVDEAIRRGAAAIVVQAPLPTPPRVGVVRVADTTRALGLLGRAHRRRWSARNTGTPRTLIAVAGSAGKTTTRRAIATLLGHLGARVHYAAGNFNNAIGIPLVLLGLEDEHDTAVIEIGTSEPGDVAYGVELTQPDVGVLTLVAMEHGEGLGSLDDITREEGTLLAGLLPGATAIVNGDDARAAAQLFRSPAERWVLYGKAKHADVRLALRSAQGLRGSQLALTLRNDGRRSVRDGAASEVSFTIETPLLGEAGAYATVAAVAVATTVRSLAARLTSETMTAAFSALAATRDAGRLVPQELADGVVLLDDSYNANAASVAAGISAAQEIAQHFGRRLVLVLGEMRELGRFAAAEHDAVADMVLHARPTRVIAVSGDAARIAQHACDGGLDAVFAADAASAQPLVLDTLRPGDVVLVKGSRGVGLDVLVRAIIADRGPHLCFTNYFIRCTSRPRGSGS